MKSLKLYDQLGLITEKDVFEYFIQHLTDSIFTWDYFVDFNKIKARIENIEIELNILNSLIGKQNISDRFIELIKQYPQVRKILPILIAIRREKLKQLKIIEDIDLQMISLEKDLFDPKIKLTSQIIEKLLSFFENSGLLNIFKSKSVKNVVDYCFGVEVGMDTNARKNRTGKIMEKLIEQYLQKESIDFISQATKEKIIQKWNRNITLDKTNRRFDFAIKTNKLFLIEVNYYSSQGSKLKSTAGEYQSLFRFFQKQSIELIWITDGFGWTSAKRALRETFQTNDYLLNLDLVKKGALKQIILS